MLGYSNTISRNADFGLGKQSSQMYLNLWMYFWCTELSQSCYKFNGLLNLVNDRHWFNIHCQQTGSDHNRNAY